MATLLNIETSTDVCSVALTADGYILHHIENFEGPNHASLLSDYIYDCLKYLENHDGLKLDGVAVSIGPGSYTGLRIGLSEAKGIAYGLNIPLLGINTLKIIACETMFSLPDFDSEKDFFQPMIDARRNEVYTAQIDGLMNYTVQPGALILGESDLKVKENSRLIISGNGVNKAKKFLPDTRGIVFINDIVPLATGMLPLSEQAWRDRDFIDTAYSIPFYIKDFYPTTPKNKIVSNSKKG